MTDWLTYLDRHGVDWRAARLEDVAGFVAWLRVPPQARDGLVSVLPTVEPFCSASSVNRKLGVDVLLRVPCSPWRKFVGVADHDGSRRLVAVVLRRRRIGRFCTMCPNAGVSGGGRSSRSHCPKS